VNLIQYRLNSLYLTKYCSNLSTNAVRISNECRYSEWRTFTFMLSVVIMSVFMLTDVAPLIDIGQIIQIFLKKQLGKINTNFARFTVIKWVRVKQHICSLFPWTYFLLIFRFAWYQQAGRVGQVETEWKIVGISGKRIRDFTPPLIKRYCNTC